MAAEVILPRVDMDMTEGKIALWHVANGDTVAKGQVIFEMETDKATMEVEASADGVIHGIEHNAGLAVPVGQVVAWISHSGESAPSAAVPSVAAPHLTALPPAAREPIVTHAAIAGSTGAENKLRATPLARSIARGQGIELGTIQGSGPGGRIYAGDLAHLDAPTPTTTPTAAGDANDLHLHWFARHGSTPLVMLHGFASDLGSWRPLVGQLAGVSALGIDLPGHGKSARIAAHNFGELARVVVARLDAEGIGQVHLLGHSMGGAAALSMVGLLKSRLRSLTLLAPAGFGAEINGAFIHGLLRATREESLRPWLAQLFGSAAGLSASFVATTLQQLRSQEKRETLQAMADMFFPDGTQAECLSDRLAGLEQPVKIVWGTLDRVIARPTTLDLPGNVALHTFPGVGHLPQVEAVSLLSALVRQQIAAASSSGQ